MTLTQLIAIAVCGAIGYWLVAVFLPLIVKSKDGYSEAPEEEQGNRSNDGAPKGYASGDMANPKWFEVLEVSEHSSATEIAAAYRQKIRQYHPDRVAQMGQDIRQLAERRSSEINGAYEVAMRLRGRPL